MPEGLEEWWYEKDVGGTLWDVLPAVVDAFFCRAKLSTVRCFACDRIFVD